MVGVIFELKDFIKLIKWGTRIGLIAFFAVGIYMLTQGTDIFYSLQTEHITTTVAIAALSALAFLPLILPKPKRINPNGGEQTVMRKLYIFIIAVIAFLIGIVTWVFIDTEAAKAAIGGIGGGLGEGIINTFMQINATLSGLEPYVNSTIFFIVGIFFTIISVNILIPKAKRIISPYQPPVVTDYQQEPGYTPPVNINQPQPIPKKEEPE